MKLLLKLAAPWALSAALGCTGGPIKAPFDEAPLKAYAEAGQCRIEGQAFGKTRGGDVKYAAGETVIVMPVTTYTQEIFDREALIDHRNWMMPNPPHDPRLDPYLRETRCDAEGRFTFEELPEGDYFVTCGVYWEYVNGSYTQNTGGVAKARAKASPAKPAKIVLTP